VLACDFFTVETAFLKTPYVLFFIDLSTRRVHIAGATTRPNWVWVTQQARNLAMVGTLDGRFLIRDRDTKFSGPFDEVFRTEGVAVVKTPVQAATANAVAERWVGTVRGECLDHILILGRRHLERVLTIYGPLQSGEAAPGTGPRSTGPPDPLGGDPRDGDPPARPT